MTFIHTRRTFDNGNHGPTPISFLQDLLDWAKTAPDDIFAPNSEPGDAFNLLKPEGGWQSLAHRKATLLDAAVVHAGFESDWKWNEGVDTTNKTSLAYKTGEETGPWQVSADSQNIHHRAMFPFAEAHGIGIVDVDKFIVAMKTNKPLSCEYYFRLLRVSTTWAGPWNKGWITRDISPAAVAEWQALLA